MEESMDRRNDLRSWFADVGYIYLLVVVFVVLAFLLRDLSRSRRSWGPDASAPAAAVEQPAPVYGAGPQAR